MYKHRLGARVWQRQREISLRLSRSGPGSVKGVFPYRLATVPGPDFCSSHKPCSAHQRQRGFSFPPVAPAPAKNNLVSHSTCPFPGHFNCHSTMDTQAWVSIVLQILSWPGEGDVLWLTFIDNLHLGWPWDLHTGSLLNSERQRKVPVSQNT